MGHTITFFASRNKSKMKWKNNGNVDEFISYVNSMIGKQANSSIDPTKMDDIPTQIKKLAELKEQGILTDEEFNKKKTELLNKM